MLNLNLNNLEHKHKVSQSVSWDIYNIAQLNRMLPQKQH